MLTAKQKTWPPWLGLPLKKDVVLPRISTESNNSDSLIFRVDKWFSRWETRRKHEFHSCLWVFLHVTFFHICIWLDSQVTGNIVLSLEIFYRVYYWWRVCANRNNSQGCVLVLCSGITLGSAQGTSCRTTHGNPINLAQGKHLKPNLLVVISTRINIDGL